MRFRFIRNIIFYLFIFVIIAIGVSWFHFLKKPAIPAGKMVFYTLKSGSGVMDFAYGLHRLGYMENPRYFIWYIQMKGATKKLHAGNYAFKGPLTPKNLLAQVVSGRTGYERLTLVEGWTFAQVMQAVNNNSHLVHLLKDIPNDHIMAKLGYGQQNPEGRFYPSTYLFPPDDTDINCLQRAYQMMAQHLTNLWPIRQNDLPYRSSDDALIVASLIEKESALRSERPQVAGVIVRRLKKGMLLQIDPTVIYGLGVKYQGSLHHEDMSIDSPYNTYRYKGLPPTPIALPSLSSLQAALNPATGNTYYFVARGDAPGHIFSATFAEHQKAVQRFINIRRIQEQQKKALTIIPPLKPVESIK